MEQETLIYVEDNDKQEAAILTKGLMNEEVKNRAFINALGAELGLKYLALENINNSKTYNLHNVHRLLEEFDISDIMLSNIHLDVRVIFDENQIFIPKSHFEYDILPDIYLVFLLTEDTSHVKFLGFFEPKLINKNNHNADYYFIEKEKLSSPLDLKSYVENFKGNRTESLSDEINEAAQTLMVSVVDQNASKEEMKELFKYLTKSSYLRDRFIEFENFEILSYKAERSPDIKAHEAAAVQDEEIIDATIDDLKQPEEVSGGDENIIAETAGAAAAIAGAAGVVEAAETAIESGIEAGMEMPGLNLEEQVAPEGIEDLPPLDNISLDEAPTAEVKEEQAPAPVESSAELPVPEEASAADVEQAVQPEEVSHDFVEGNADDFFNDLGVDESNDGGISFDNVDESAGKISMEDSFEDVSVDFNTMAQSELPRPDDMPSDDEVEILDISDVDAVPNNYDQNISETVEFTNIELANEGPCMNEVNGEQTVPMLNMTDFKPLEPIQESESFKAESYDMDSLSITDNMLPMPKLEPVNESIAPVDMDNIAMGVSLPPIPDEVADNAEPLPLPEPVSEVDKLSSELDAIPDFGMEGMELSDDIPPLESEEPAPLMPENGMSDEKAEALENLSVDDIVDAPASETSEPQPISLEEGVPVADFEDLQLPQEPPVEAEAAAAVPPDLQAAGAQIPEISEETISDDIISESSENEEVQPANDDEADLTALFNEVTSDENFSDDFNNLGDISTMPTVAHHKQSGAGKMIAVAAVAALLVVGGVFGFSSLKNKNGMSEPEPLSQAVPENTEAQQPIADNSDILANTPEVQTLPAPQKEPVNVKQDKPQAKTTAAADKTANKGTPLTYMGISKLSWEVPDYLSYSDNIKKYLQTVGKSIKLTLSSDLLLVTEYAYSNQMKVDMKLSNDGTLKDSKIVKSSGSKQIDNIVLQTVKETLNVVKPAAGEVPTAEFHLALIINF